MTGKNFGLKVETLTPELRLLAVTGELDLFAAPELKQTIADALEGDTRDLIVDLTGTDFIDSSGLAALILAMKRARSRGGQMVVVDAGGERRPDLPGRRRRPDPDDRRLARGRPGRAVGVRGRVDRMCGARGRGRDRA